jgi:hypothetical protein
VPYVPPGGGGLGGFGPRVANLFAGSGKGHPTLQALMQRQQELAGRKGGVPQIQSWTQGAAHMLDQLFEGLERGRTNRRLEEGNQVQADVLSQADPVTGLVSPDKLDALASWNPELFAQLMGDWRQNRQFEATLEAQKAKTAADAAQTGAPKVSDVSAMRAQLMGDESYTAASNIGQIYGSMLKSAPKDDRTSDLDMVSGLAKMIDPVAPLALTTGEPTSSGRSPRPTISRSIWSCLPSARYYHGSRKRKHRLKLPT